MEMDKWHSVKRIPNAGDVFDSFNENIKKISEMRQNSSVFNLLPHRRHPRLQRPRPLGIEWKPIEKEIHELFFHRSLAMQSVSPNLISIKIQIIW